MYKTTPVNAGKKLLRKLRKDPVATQNPYIPVQGPSSGGRIATTHNVTQSFIQSLQEDV